MERLQYAAHAPLTAYVWNHHLGIKPIVFIVKRDSVPTKQEQFITASLLSAGARVETVVAPSNFSTQTCAQIVRLSAFSLSYVQPDDYVITTDADIWPMSTAYWKDMFHFNKHVTIVNGEFFNPDPRVEVGIAMCYVGAHACTWRTLVTETHRAFFINSSMPLLHMDPTSISKYLLELGQAFRGEKWRSLAKGGDQWYWDQIFTTHAFRHLVKEYNMTLAKGSGVQAGRLDRSNWRFAGSIERHTDAHLVFPLTSQAVWQQIKPVWHSMFNTTDWADTYRNQLLQIYL